MIKPAQSSRFFFAKAEVMKITRLFLLASLLALCALLITWFLLGSQLAVQQPQDMDRVGQRVRAKFDQLSVGMTLNEAEAIMGPSEGNYSSQLLLEYHIWKDPDGWVSITVKNGEVSEMHIRPAP